jgi:hypothetical protein
MKDSTRFGTVNDLIEDINGGNASLVYLSDTDPNRLASKYNEIKAGKQIVSAYSIGKLHVLAIYLEGKFKIKTRGEK